MYKSGSLTIEAWEFARYKLDLVGVQEIRRNKGGILRVGDYILLKRKRKSSIRTRIFLHHRILSAVNTVEFVSDRVSYIVLRGRWCNVIVLNVYATSEEKSDDSKHRFYEELDQVFRSFSLNTARKFC